MVGDAVVTPAAAGEVTATLEDDALASEDDEGVTLGASRGATAGVVAALALLSLEAAGDESQPMATSHRAPRSDTREPKPITSSSVVIG
jgi:hypothetical protein